VKKLDQKLRIGISYAWRPEEDETNENYGRVTEFCKKIEAKGYRVMRDRDFLKPDDSLSEFMRQLANREHLYIFLSKAYLESRNCMYELLVAWQRHYNDANAAMERIHVFTFNDARIYDEETRAEYVEYWAEKKAIAEKRRLTQARSNVLGSKVADRINTTCHIAQTVGDFLETVADRFAPKDFDEYVEQAIACLPGVQDDQDGHSTLQRLNTPPPDRQSADILIQEARANFKQALEKMNECLAMNTFCQEVAGFQGAGVVAVTDALFPLNLNPESRIVTLLRACQKVLASVDDTEFKKRVFDIAKDALLWLSTLSVSESWLDNKALHAKQILSGEFKLFVKTSLGAWIIRSRLYGRSAEISCENGVDLRTEFNLDSQPILQAPLRRDQQIQIVKELLRQLPGYLTPEMDSSDDIDTLEELLKERFDHALKLDFPYVLTATRDKEIPYARRYLLEMTEKWQNVLIAEVGLQSDQEILALSTETDLGNNMIHFFGMEAKLNDNT